MKKYSEAVNYFNTLIRKEAAEKSWPNEEAKKQLISEVVGQVKSMTQGQEWQTDEKFKTFSSVIDTMAGNPKYYLDNYFKGSAQAAISSLLHSSYFGNYTIDKSGTGKEKVPRYLYSQLERAKAVDAAQAPAATPTAQTGAGAAQTSTQRKAPRVSKEQGEAALRELDALNTRMERANAPKPAGQTAPKKPAKKPAAQSPTFNMFPDKGPWKGTPYRQ